MEVPLIYTSKGNLPIASLRYDPVWEDTPDYTKFVERYWLDGELVKESAHILHKHGISSDALQQAFS